MHGVKPPLVRYERSIDAALAKLRKAGLTSDTAQLRRLELREAGDPSGPPAPTRGLGEGALEQREHAAPRALGLRFVVDLRIGRAPAVRGRVDLDLGLSFAFANVSRSTFFASGSRSSSFSATANRYCSLHLRHEQVRAVRVLRDETAAVERRRGADAIREPRRQCAS